MSIAELFNWEIISVDVTTAFLQSVTLNRDVYIRPPIESGEKNLIWRLKASLRARRRFGALFLKISRVLSDFGLKLISNPLCPLSQNHRN